MPLGVPRRLGQVGSGDPDSTVESQFSAIEFAAGDSLDYGEFGGNIADRSVIDHTDSLTGAAVPHDDQGMVAIPDDFPGECHEPHGVFLP